jgi:hypothetical protein
VGEREPEAVWREYDCASNLLGGPPQVPQVVLDTIARSQAFDSNHFDDTVAVVDREEDS